jgi:hypothetical protein
MKQSFSTMDGVQIDSYAHATAPVGYDFRHVTSPDQGLP